VKLQVDGRAVYAYSANHELDASRRTIAFIHGAGLDHSSFALQSRYFGYHGWNVLALDLPGHGRSRGEPLQSIGAMADWTAALIATTNARAVRLVGHSMGSLIALETAARHPQTITGLGLIGTAAAMPVSSELLSAARADDHAAIDMVSIWGHGMRATLGGSLMPGLWMLGGAERLLERAGSGVLFKDLAACNEYRNALSSAAKVSVPVTLILGERDLMTPAKAGKALAATFPSARVVILKGAGHLLMSERPDEVLEALRSDL